MISYIIGLVGLGTAAGIHTVAQRRYFARLGHASRGVAFAAAVAALALMVAGLLILPREAALLAIFVGTTGAVILSFVLPPKVELVVLSAAAGFAAAVTHFVLI